MLQAGRAQGGASEDEPLSRGQIMTNRDRDTTVPPTLAASERCWHLPVAQDLVSDCQGMASAIFGRAVYCITGEKELSESRQRRAKQS